MSKRVYLAFQGSYEESGTTYVIVGTRPTTGYSFLDIWRTPEQFSGPRKQRTPFSLQDLCDRRRTTQIVHLVSQSPLLASMQARMGSYYTIVSWKCQLAFASLVLII